MMNAAVGVWPAAVVSHDAMFALGVVLTIFSLAALSLYRLKPGLDYQQTKVIVGRTW
jgi:DHA1 family bicyclomycin/chloramphenicol resistance-like MFS transporter